MVLLIPLIAAIPTTIGVAEGVSSQRRENAANSSSAAEEKAQMRKFTLECYCDERGKRGKQAREIHGGKVVLKGGKLWITSSSASSAISLSNAHPFEGFYISYPDPTLPPPPPLGLVSTIDSDPPMLNWIYIDRHTRELKYGNRTQSRAHIVGPWGWDAGEEGGAGGLTCGGEEMGIAIWRDGQGEGEEGIKGWQVKWEDGEGKGREGGLRISLDRKWVDGGEEGEEEGEGEGEREEKDEAQDDKHTKTTFQITQTSAQRKKKEPAHRIELSRSTK